MGRHTIEICADASIDDFDDDVILEAALGAIERHRKDREPPKENKRIHNLWFENEMLVQRIAAALGVDMRPDLPPPSTAAKFQSIEDLRAYVAKSPLYSAEAT